MTDRVVAYLEERRSGSYTDLCSRSDLFAISRLLSSRNNWGSREFVEAKAQIKERFGLSSGAFTRCLEVIQTNREMRAVIGFETDLLFLTDEKIILIAAEWRKIHPVRTAESQSAVTPFRLSLKDILTDKAEHKEVVGNLVVQLSLDELAELQALFYLGRDPYFTEFYHNAVQRYRRQPDLTSNPSGYLSRIFDKTNLLTCLQRSTNRLGRLELAPKLSDM